MTSLVLGVIALAAAITLVGVLTSIVRSLRAEKANSRLRRDGMVATGTVIDNTMTSTPQRRLTFCPVVEFHTGPGRLLVAPAQQSAASSWPRGATVEVRYDAADPSRFVLAEAPGRSNLVANTIVGLLVVAIMAAMVVGMYQTWWKFRYDQDRPASAVSSQGAHRGQ